ncbi:MAG: transglycosylase SLT domain-containing protein [Nitrosomonas sp.]|nr:MAG: transglycosylase SLT domain-containing protein [Nitrosomonas sp.]
MILRRNFTFIAWLLLLIALSALLPSHSLASRQIQDKSQQQYSNLWDRIRNGFALAYPPDAKTIRKIALSYTQNPVALGRMLASGERYLFYIVEEVERRGMPMEIALIPFVESAYNPLIKSNSQTAGLWQFIPQTGKNLGLAQNVWHDDRRDIVASTQAALDYLEYLHNKFNNWKLAIAAYNIGEGVVGKVLSKSLHKGHAVDFYELNLPSEVRYYLYKLLAVKQLIVDSRKFGLQLRSIPNRPYFDQVQIHDHIDISLVTHLANISPAEFSALNPAYNRYAIKILDQPRILLLPVDKKESFVKNLETYQDPQFSWQLYSVKKGEKINEIAVRHGTSLQQLQAINGIARNKNLVLGQKILVPKIEAFRQAEQNTPREKLSSNGLSDIHIVKKGDTLYHIAKRYGTTIDQIKHWNNNDENLSVGQKLLIVRS